MMPPRVILYPMPFVGIALLGMDYSNILDIPSGVSLFVLLLPGSCIRASVLGSSMAPSLHD